MQEEMPQVLNLDQESPATREMYGLTSPNPDAVAFGKRCLLARRLIESGVRFVQVIAMGWDSHDYIDKAHGARIRAIDRGIAGLLQDLKQRGLLDETLVVWAGEFGRSPDNGIRRGAAAWGRDHNAQAMNVWLAGAGVKRGAIIGATDETGERAVEVVHPLKDFHVTLLHLLGLDDNRLRYFHGGREKQLSQVGGQVIRELLI
jgi:membrane-anchored protein YejM (alkaline phosphatase superfamily)